MPPPDKESLPLLLRFFGFNALCSTAVFTILLDKACDGFCLNESCISECISTMALTIEDSSLNVPQTASAHQLLVANGFSDAIQQTRTTWDLDVFVACVRVRCPNIDWVAVIRNLDRPAFRLSSLRGLELIVDVYRKGCQEKKKFPIQLLFSEWTNPLSQYSLLANFVSAPPEVFNFADYTGTEVQKILTPEELPIVSPGSAIVTLPNQALNCLDVIATFVLLQKNASCRPDISQFLLNASVQAPELTLLGLVQIQEPWAENHAERVSTLAKSFALWFRPSAPFVVRKMWSLECARKHLFAAFLDLYRAQARHLLQIFNVLRDLDALDVALCGSDLFFCVDLAIIASDNNSLDLATWLQGNSSDRRRGPIGTNLWMNDDQFTPQVMFSSIEDATVALIRKKLSPAGAYANAISRQAATVLCKFLLDRLGGKLPDDIALLGEIHSTDSVDALGNHEGRLETDDTLVFSPEVEKEAITLLEGLLMNRVSQDAFITHINSLKSSPNPEDNNLFECIVNTFIDEARFISSYPDSNLVIAATVLGMLVACQIPSHDSVLRMMEVLNETLHEQPGDPKFLHFALTVVSRFLHLIPKYQDFFQNLIKLPAVMHNAPDLATLVRECVPSKYFTSINSGLELFGSLAYPEVPTSTQEKISFLINNLSPSNVCLKQREVAEHVTPEYYRWFSSYMVCKRVAIEPNFHSLYLTFLEEFKNPELYKCLLYDTFALAENIFNSENNSLSDSDKGRLKNIGNWLGSLTISRNKPILQKNLHFKRLLIEAHECNRLSLAIPFVCKVFEHAKDSRVFLPPNPWVTAVLSLLVEIYHHAEIKLNLKFEIEVLFKNLSIEFSSVKPSSLLGVASRTASSKAKSISQQTKIITSGRASNPPHSDSAESAVHPEPSRLALVQAQLMQQELDKKIIGRPRRRSEVDDSEDEIVPLASVSSKIPELLLSLKFNSSLRVLTGNPATKQAVGEALGKAFGEIISEAVERAILIAVVTTRDLLVKDFALEQDEQKMRRSAHSLAILLAGTLTQMTCKEPLAVSMASSLRQIFPADNSPAVEQTIRILVEENIDLGVALIVRTAKERAVHEIDERLAQSYLVRKQAREQGRVFGNLCQEQKAWLPTLPECLRIVLGGLTPHQLAIYSNHNVALDKGIPVEKAFEMFNSLLASLARNINSLGQSKEVPSSHEVRDLVRQAPQYLPNGHFREKVASKFCSKLIQLLFASDMTMVGREIYAVTLREICGQGTSTMQDVKEWLLFSTDTRKLNVAAICATLKAGIIKIHEFDPQMARLTNVDEGVAEFSAELITTAVTQAITLEQDWMFTIDSLNRIAHRTSSSDNVKAFVEFIRRRAKGQEAVGPTNQSDESFSLKNRLAFTFAEWVRVCQNSNPTTEVCDGFICELERLCVTSDDEIFSVFYRVCVEISVEAWSKVNLNASAPVLAYHAIDSLAKLAVLHATHFVSRGQDTVIDIVSKILSIIVLILVNSHELQMQQFSQRPFYRLFSSILHEIQSNELELGYYFPEIYGAFSTALHSLQPVFVPGFAFSWINLISNTHLLGQLLSMDSNGSWASYAKLLVNLFAFIRPFLRPCQAKNAAKKMLLGTFRLMVVIFHDFPDFLCAYSFVLCSVIPVHCIQLRNMILGAYPAGTILPDLLDNVELDSNFFQAGNNVPKISTDAMRLIIATAGLGSETWEVSTVISKIQERGCSFSESKYNIDLLHAVVAICGFRDTEQHMFPFYYELLSRLDSEGRYFVLVGVANQLRYPSTHTRYFKSLVLWLFTQDNGGDDGLREQITRVLLERLVVNPPHQWGVLSTFLEILRNPEYGFWGNEFTQCSSDVQMLFRSVSTMISTESLL